MNGGNVVNELFHYGIKRRSGRYPYGSGKRPYQSLSPMAKKGAKKKQSLARDVFGKEVSRSKLVSNNSDDQKGLSIKKGDKVQHISGVPFETLRKGQLYVTATDYDNKLYEAFLSANLKSKGWDPRKITLTAMEDINAPSNDHQKELFDSFYKQNRKEVIADLKDWLSSKGKDTSQVSNVQNDTNKMYDYFMNSVEKSSATQKAFYDLLKSKGYNAVLDSHDITGSWMQGKKPLIIMDALSSVGDIKIDDISTDRMVEAFEEWLKMN